MAKKAAVTLTPEEQLEAFKKIVDNTDEHRNRSRRESWDAIKAVLNGELPAEEEPVVEEPTSDAEPDESSTEDTAESDGESAEELAEEGELPAEEEPAVVEGAAPERKRRFAETPDEG
jgi:hypothetical protein